MVVLAITNDSQFQSQLAYHSNKLVIVDFTAAWCGHCLLMSPVFEQLSKSYPKAVFIKVDVDVCRDTAASQGVSTMPTFIFYRNRTRIDRLIGGDHQLLEDKIVQYHGSGTDSSDEMLLNSQGHMDLIPFVKMKQCEALNESNTHPLTDCLTSGDGYLESCCDNQLIISITFSQVVKIHALKIKAPTTNGPKTLKLFSNQPNTLDFDEAANKIPTQVLEINTNSLACGYPIPLRFVKFQNVHNIQLFIEDNQDGSETTQIDHLQLFGSPIMTTNMNDFKSLGVNKS